MLEITRPMVTSCPLFFPLGHTWTTQCASFSCSPGMKQWVKQV
jgi:hypothetical protein